MRSVPLNEIAAVFDFGVLVVYRAQIVEKNAHFQPIHWLHSLAIVALAEYINVSRSPSILPLGWNILVFWRFLEVLLRVVIQWPNHIKKLHTSKILRKGTPCRSWLLGEIVFFCQSFGSSWGLHLLDVTKLTKHANIFGNIFVFWSNGDRVSLRECIWCIRYFKCDDSLPLHSGNPLNKWTDILFFFH